MTRYELYERAAGLTLQQSDLDLSRLPDGYYSICAGISKEILIFQRNVHTSGVHTPKLRGKPLSFFDQAFDMSRDSSGY